MSTRVTRRRFLQSSAALGAGYWLTASARSAARAADSPNDKLHFACIGVGGKGSQRHRPGRPGRRTSSPSATSTTTPWTRRPSKFPEAKKFSDFRKMFDEMGKEIDAVTVSTPDHNHAPAASWP